MDIFFLVVFTAAALLGAIFLWVLLFNNEDGERYMKQRMQGPFVPVHPNTEEAQTETNQK